MFVFYLWCATVVCGVLASHLPLPLSLCSIEGVQFRFSIFFLVFLWVSHDYLAAGVRGGGSTFVNGGDGVLRARGVPQSYMERFHATLPAHFVDAISVAFGTFPCHSVGMGRYFLATGVCGGVSTFVNGGDGVFRARGVSQSHMERFHATLPAHSVDAISVAKGRFPCHSVGMGRFHATLPRHTLWTRFQSHMERFHATLSAHFVDAISVLFCAQHIITTTPHYTTTQHNTTPPQRNFCVGGGNVVVCIFTIRGVSRLDTTLHHHNTTFASRCQRYRPDIPGARAEPSGF